MIARSGRRWLGALALLLAPAAASAQAVADPLARPLSSYRDLDYDAAATALRAALTADGSAKLGDADRVRALMYLGATEVFRGRKDAALDAFRTILLQDARYRPDNLVFPPDVSIAFTEARASVHAVAVVVPRITEIQATTDRLPVRLVATTPHDVRAVILDALGGPVRVLHEGPMGDSLDVPWNGRDGLGRLREPGRYRLRVTSRSGTGRDEREVELPLLITRIAEDTLATPPAPSGLRAETGPPSGGTRYLATGLAAAAVTAALPSVAGAGSEGGGLRFGVVAAFSAAGIYGLLKAREPRPIPENVDYNRRLRDAWAREVQRVQDENAARRIGGRLRIEAGAAVLSEVR